ncbi:MAG: MFS transporter [Firmicutes bacterium]|nr:MFS transporter [Bacillota bacterium]MBR3260098.1 MFS transporter [Bacillota bacterium]MBR3375248.1 MFS transporter [Bacillota bacterium]MBR6955369.1 MFS transporter [Bacillota bacterium]
MKNYTLKLNSEYAGVFGTYWMYYGIISSFCSAYLLDMGYDNAEIGIILAVASVVSVFLQPVLANLSDMSKRLDAISVAGISTVIMMVMQVGLFIIKGKSIALWVIYVLLMAWELALQPLFNSLARRLSESGFKINFGICRAGGSLAYAIFTSIIGTFVEKYGTVILPRTGLAILALLLGMILLCSRSLKKAMEQKADAVAASGETVEPEKYEEISMSMFVKRNKLFIVLNVFIMILFFQNTITNNFMYQIVTGVGGTSEDMGRIFGVMAALEIPGLFFFNNIHKKFSCSTLLKFAAAAFVGKVLTLYLANSVFMVYAAHFFQLFSFSIFLAGIVQFINEIMERGEAVRGQAVYTTAITIGGVFANIAGGIILDVSGPKVMLLVSTILTVIGAAGVFLLIGKIDKKSENP